MATDILTISSYSLLSKLMNHKDGELAYVIDEDAYYAYSEERGTWEVIELENAPTKEQLKMTMYDMTKQVIKQLPPFDETRKKDMADAIKAWKRDDVNSYMLYGKEISYFTLFQKQVLAGKNFIQALFYCLENISDAIYEYEIVDENTVLIWLDYQGDATAMYLFNYDEGVVIYNG
jgi:hypothetical protein